MKKAIFYTMSSLAAIFIMSRFLSGLGLAGLEGVILLSVFIVLGMYLSQFVMGKMGQEGALWVFALINLVFVFISIYLGDAISDQIQLEDGGVFREHELFFFTTPEFTNLDQIVTILLASIVAVGVTSLTKWASDTE